MIKKFVYIGIILIVLAAVLFLTSGYLLSNGISKNVSIANLTVKQYNFSYYPATYYNTSEIAIYVLASQSVNIYILNSTTFSIWRNYVTSNKSANGLNYVEQLKVNSTDIFQNKKSLVAPLIVNSSKNYSKNVLYVVIDNTLGSPSTSTPLNASVAVLPLQTSNQIPYEVLGLLSLVCFIAGIILLIYGILKKEQPKLDASGNTVQSKEQKDKEYVDQLYKNVNRGKKKKSQ